MPNLLLLHGHAPLDSLAPLARELAPHCTLTADSRPGYGGIPNTWDAAPESIASELELLHHDCAPWIVAGHSYGAYLALLLALRANLDIVGVVVLAPVAHLDPTELGLMAQFADALEAGADLAPNIIPMWFSETYRAATPALENEVRGWIAHSREGLIADLRATTLWRDLRPNLHELRVPVLVRAGECDAPAPPERAQDIASRIPHAEFEIAPGKGHMLGMEDATQTAHHMLAWMAQLES